jgi:endonuclease III
LSIQDRLSRELTTWKEIIEHFGQVTAVQRREAGSRWSDDELFEALLRAVLSNNTQWSRVEMVLPELKEVFHNFSLESFANSAPNEINERILPWFIARKAGSMTLKSCLHALRTTAQILLHYSAQRGSAEDYFQDVMHFCGEDPKEVAIALGQPSSPKKLPGFGIPIAAEALRNMGYDICKPDRHMCRAAGSFGLVTFRTWKDQRGTKAPVASSREMLAVMRIFEEFAKSTGERVTFIDNAVWLLCARGMGLHLSNEGLRRIAEIVRR